MNQRMARLLRFMFCGICLGCSKPHAPAPSKTAPPAVAMSRQSDSDPTTTTSTTGPAPAPARPRRQVAVYEGPTHPKMPSADAPVDRVKARGFYDDVQQGDAATAKYDGHWVEVEGILDQLNVTMFKTGGYILTALMTDTGEKLCVVTCWMAPGERPWEQAANKERITIRGAFSKQYGAVALCDCKIIEPSEKKMLNVTVDELADLYESGHAAFNKDQNYRQAILTGKYVGHFAPPNTEKPDLEQWVALEGESGRRSYCFTGRPDFLTEAVTEGEQVSVIGLFFGLFSADDPFDELNLQATQNMTLFKPARKP